MHTGTANSGHYYSFIKERGCFSSTSSSSHKKQTNWYEFNDNIVSDFDADLMDVETFGGRVDHGTQVKNAFMLIYDKVYHNHNSDNGNDYNSNNDNDNDDDNDNDNDNQHRFIATVPDSLALKVWSDNMEYRRISNLFDSSHLEFVSCLLESEFKYYDNNSDDNDDNDNHNDNDDNDMMMKDGYMNVLYNFILSSLIRSKNINLLQLWLPKLSSIVLSSQQGCIKFLKRLIHTNHDKGKDLRFSCLYIYHMYSYILIHTHTHSYTLIHTHTYSYTLIHTHTH